MLAAGSATSSVLICQRKLIVFSFFLTFYLFLRQRERERERAHVSRGEAEREGDTASEAGSRL